MEKKIVIFNLQIKGKESENSYQELKRSQKGQTHTNTRKLNRDISTGTAVFLNRKRVNVCEHTTKMASLDASRNISFQFPCVCVCLSLLWSLQFLVRVFTFLSLNLWILIWLHRFAKAIMIDVFVIPYFCKFSSFYNIFLRTKALTWSIIWIE